jgi:hypothetical protein
MPATIQQSFITFDENDNCKQYKFDLYLKDNFPDYKDGCVYIFSIHLDNRIIENRHIDCTPRFSELFPEKNIDEDHKKFGSNAILIYKSTNIDEMENIVRWIRRSHNIPIKL